MSQYQLGFYIHHHGSGHVMRCIRIAEEFTDKRVTFLGSNLKPFMDIIPKGIKCIDLPMDVVGGKEVVRETFETCKNFLYAPLNVSGVRKRNQLLVDFFADSSELLFIVDTSPEIIALARLCSIPTIMVQQHGDRNDLAHHLAYDNAIKIIAPFPEQMTPDCPHWVKEKTLYTGGFSKFDGVESTSGEDKTVGVIVGSGGTTIDLNFLCHLAKTAPKYIFNVIGNVETDGRDIDEMPENLLLLGLLNNPLAQLKRCNIIIGNAGHNTVMEVASLNKRFICIPEKRPFLEQVDKANRLSIQYGVNVILPENLMVTDWQNLLDKTYNQAVDWKDIISTDATKLIRKEMDRLAIQFFA